VLRCFFASRRRHTISDRDWSSDVCSSDLVLEQMVRRLLAAGAPAERITPAPEPLAVAPPAAPIPRRHEPRSYSPPPAAAPDLEQWFGQRGLLIVGVLALLTAAGFFLKYAIVPGGY